MSEKKELNQEQLEKVSGGLVEDNDDDFEEEIPIIKGSVEGNDPEVKIGPETSARPYPL